jgi:hypothetical protein
MPAIIGATGIVTRSLRKNLEHMLGKHLIDSLQKTAVLGTSHIIRKVLQCETWSLNGLWQETIVIVIVIVIVIITIIIIQVIWLQFRPVNLHAESTAGELITEAAQYIYIYIYIYKIYVDNSLIIALKESRYKYRHLITKHKINY